MLVKSILYTVIGTNWYYSHDEIADPQYASLPEAVVKPASAAEIAALLKLANRELIPVTPRGQVADFLEAVLFRGIVLSTERMNRIQNR